MDYKEFMAKLVKLYEGYAKKYPQSEWVKTMLANYRAALKGCAGMTIDAQQAENIIKANEEFESVLRDNLGLTTKALNDGDFNY